MRNKIISLFAVIMMSVSFLYVDNVNAITFEPSNMDMLSESAYLVNMDTDTAIFEKNKDEKLLPASLTKIMTAIIALEEVEDLEVVVESPISVFNEIYNMNASNAGIMAFEKVRMIDLLYGLILPSGCEAGGIIADYIGGGNQQVFIDMMNKKAKELGAENTYFHDAHGLDDDHSYTTAYDMYVITKYAMENPLFEEIVTTPVYEMPATNKHPEPRNIYHTNSMIRSNSSYYYEYAKGVKTGTTGIDTKNLVSYAEKDGYTYMLVILGGPRFDAKGEYQEPTYIDSKKLYDWAFDKVQVRKIIDTNEEICEVDVALGKEQDYVLASPSEAIELLMPIDIELSSIQKIITKEENLFAPVEKGQKIGTVTLKLKDEEIGTVDLLATKDIEQDPIAFTIYSARNFIQMREVHLAAIAVAVLFLLIIVLRALHRNKKKKLRYQKFSSKSKKHKR